MFSKKFFENSAQLDFSRNKIESVGRSYRYHLNTCSDSSALRANFTTFASCLVSEGGNVPSSLYKWLLHLRDSVPTLID